LKRRSVEKHVSLRRRRCRSSPRRNVVVERRSGLKHKPHTSINSINIIPISHFLCIPTPNVLVESRSGMKHPIHINHFSCIPTPNVLVKRRSVIKHSIHNSHLRCVPPSNVLVERRTTTKHMSHISHLPGFPLRNVAVEGGELITKALILLLHKIPSTHIFHQTRVPIRHRPVVITRRPLSALSSTFGPFFR
jgi:hypothetical protein